MTPNADYGDRPEPPPYAPRLDWIGNAEQAQDTPRNSERDIWRRELAKVGIPEQYWAQVIEAAHNLETLADDGMRWVPPSDGSGT